MNKFWMVNGGNHGTAYKQHESYESAKEEAIRLCRKENLQFVILEAVESIEPDQIPIKCTKLENVTNTGPQHGTDSQ